MPEGQDREVLARFVRGDPGAFESLYFEVPNQFVLGLPAHPLDRAFLFPMAVVPNAWGLWNMLHLALRSRLRLPLVLFLNEELGIG
jgi:hypothetical protein